MSGTLDVGAVIVLNVSRTLGCVSPVVWEIAEICLGGENQQDVIGLRPLTRTQNGELRVPRELIENMIGYKRDIAIVRDNS